MLPPNLQGYAPEIRGIAKSNAKITVSREGYTLYETTVPAGPFAIQDLNSSVRGRLDVKVEEQGGSISTFQVDTATIPYLTRLGYVATTQRWVNLRLTITAHKGRCFPLAIFLGD